jgi:pyruvate formate lyase activating enzyme
MLAQELDSLAKPGRVCRAEKGRVRCLACAHGCLLKENQRGICQVRSARQNTLWVPQNYVCGLQCDPIEKKPFFHVFPGSGALTFGMVGCNFRCGFCQNWISTQALLHESITLPVRPISAEEIVHSAQRNHARLVVSSYNEPMITIEWAAHIFQKAQASGLACAMVSNGFASPEALAFIRPHLNALKIDLKCFREQSYRRMGGRLKPVMETIRLAHKLGLWLEIVTLLIPGFNSEEHEIREMAQFIKSVDPNIPWHITAFHPDYQMTNGRYTSAAELITAAEIGRSTDLNFVYTGNMPGRAGAWENTQCPQCHSLLIERRGYSINQYHLDSSGKCPHCQHSIPGLWS